MKVEAQLDQRNWFLAGGGTLLAVLLVLMLFRAPSELASGKILADLPPTALGFRILSADNVSVDLLDPTPLFLPTKWNVRPQTSFEATREPGNAFALYPALMNFPEGAINLSFPETVERPKTLVEILEVGPPAVAFTGMGRTERTVIPLNSRDAFIEIRSEKDGRSVLRQSVLNARLPSAGEWQPFEFVVGVQAAGLIGQPTVVGSGSGVEQVDAFFQNYLAKVLRVGERLPPGFYRIKIGP